MWAGTELFLFQVARLAVGLKGKFGRVSQVMGSMQYYALQWHCLEDACVCVARMSKYVATLLISENESQYLVCLKLQECCLQELYK